MFYCFHLTTALLAKLVEHQTVVWEVKGSSSRPDQYSGSQNNWGEALYCLYNYICKWLDIQVYSDKDYKP